MNYLQSNIFTLSFYSQVSESEILAPYHCGCFRVRFDRVATGVAVFEQLLRNVFSISFFGVGHLTDIRMGDRDVARDGLSTGDEATDCVASGSGSGVLIV